MKKICLLLCMLVLVIGKMAAAEPEGEPAIILKSKRGMRSSNSRTVTIYLKSLVTDNVAYFDYGLGGEIETLEMPKSATLYNKRITMTIPDATIRIWGKNISFINCNAGDIYEVIPGEDANTIFEFRCETDSISDFSFMNNMKGLTYIVLTNNVQKELHLKHDKLERCQINAAKHMTKLTLETPNVYEFKLADSQVEELDLSGCKALKTISATNNALVKSINLGDGEFLESMVFTKSMVTDLVIKDKPAFKTLSIYSSTNLTSMTLENLPLLNKITAYGCGFETLEIKDLPALATLDLYKSPLKSLTITGCPALSSFSAYETELETMDLSCTEVLKTCKLQSCKLSSIKLTEGAYATLTSFDLRDNYFALKDLPRKPTKLSATSNYYAPQQLLDLPQEAFIDDEYDLSNHMIGYSEDGAVNSKVIISTKFEEILEEGEHYSILDGKLKFLELHEDSVQCTITNEAFPLFKDENALSSSYMMIKPVGGTGIDKSMDDTIGIKVFTEGNEVDRKSVV